MPSEISKKIEEVDLNSSLQSDNGIQDIKLRLKSMKKNPWDLWELERTHRSQLGSLGKFGKVKISLKLRLAYLNGEMDAKKEFQVIAAYWISTSVLPLIEILQSFVLLDRLLVTLPPSKRFEPYDPDLT